MPSLNRLAYIQKINSFCGIYTIWVHLFKFIFFNTIRSNRSLQLSFCDNNIRERLYWKFEISINLRINRKRIFSVTTFHMRKLFSTCIVYYRGCIQQFVQWMYNYLITSTFQVIFWGRYHYHEILTRGIYRYSMKTKHFYIWNIFKK